MIDIKMQENVHVKICEKIWPKVCKLCIVVSRRKQSQFAQTASA